MRTLNQTTKEQLIKAIQGEMQDSYNTSELNDIAYYLETLSKDKLTNTLISLL